MSPEQHYDEAVLKMAQRAASERLDVDLSVPGVARLVMERKVLAVRYLELLSKCQPPVSIQTSLKP
jgi:hypothetical protein